MLCRISLFMSIFALLFTVNANAYTEQVRLYLSQDYIRNQNLDLKREISYARPDLRLDRYALESVDLRAKSFDGRSDVALLVNRRVVDSQIVHGRSRDFDTTDPRTYYDYRLSTREASDRSTWELEFRGEFKLRQITVSLRAYPTTPVPDRPGRGEWLFLGEETKVAKIIVTETSFYPGRRPISEIRLTCTREDIQIIEAYYITQDGRMESLRELTGRLNEGRSLHARVSHDRIDRIVIKAKSPGLGGSRGSYQIDAYQY